MNDDASSNRHGKRTDLIIASAATLAAVVGLLTLLWQLGVLPEKEVTPPEPLISLSKTSGGAGTRLWVTGTGFRGDEAVRLVVHVYEVRMTRTDDSGDFRARIRIPRAAAQVPLPQLYVTAAGIASGRIAQAPFELTGAREAGGGQGGGGQGGGGQPDAPTGETDLRPPSPNPLTLNCSPGPTGQPMTASITAVEDERVRVINSGTEVMDLDLFDLLQEPAEPLDPGEWHEVLLDEIGVYPYLCTFPSGIQSGRIIVQG